MKVNLNQQLDRKNVNFEGIKPVKSDTGFKEYEFSFPFDDKEFDCYLELYSVTTSNLDDYIVNEKSLANVKDGSKLIKLTTG